jgi:flagellar hook-length control protein FliK
MRSLQSKASSSAVSTTLSDFATAKINAAAAGEGSGRSMPLSTFSGDSSTERTGEQRTNGAQRIPPSQQTKIIDRIQQIAQDLVVQKTPTSMIVRLDPPELGELTVKISQRADQLFARVSAESPEVEKFLNTRVHEITNARASAGIKTDNIHVVIGKERPEAQYLPFGEGFLSGHKGQNSGDNLPRESNNQGSAQAPGLEQSDAHLAEHGLRKGTAANSAAAGWVA